MRSCFEHGGVLRYESTRTSCSFYCSYHIVLYLYVHVACRSGVLSLRRSQHSGCRHLVASHGRLLLPQRGSECVRKSTLPGTRQTANGSSSHPSITSMAPLSTAPTSQTPDIIDTLSTHRHGTHRQTLSRNTTRSCSSGYPDKKANTPP